MATIKAIEGRSVHQIQSGQVIVDLQSVCKELVENSIDAGATTVEVRFKNYGLDAIEVQDNGSGIAPDDYETIALKHYTSKLSTYEDLNSLTTFGFRGEALSSLCALSKLHIVTARTEDGPKGTKLAFEQSGKLSGKTMVAAKQGTTVVVETLFYNLPVRRKELEKNIKREYNKVLNLLNAYACISVGVKFSVSNTTKGKKTIAFATNANPSTRGNISNVYGAKTVSALIPLDLDFEMDPTNRPGITQSTKNSAEDFGSRSVKIVGHISRPVVGEGRQTPDRQMFFVNSRPCNLPQVAKAFNEAYRAYNVTQSPFIFADIQLDTEAYDVNVSPDKRTIMLHDQTVLLESLKDSLAALFAGHDQSVPKAQLLGLGTERYGSRPSTPHSRDRISSGLAEEEQQQQEADQPVLPGFTKASLIERFAGRDTTDRGNVRLSRRRRANSHDARVAPQKEPAHSEQSEQSPPPGLEQDTAPSRSRSGSPLFEPEGPPPPTQTQILQESGARVASRHAVRVERGWPDEGDLNASDDDTVIAAIRTMPRDPSSQSTIQNAFDRMRPMRTPAQQATITVGDTTTVSTIGSSSRSKQERQNMIHVPKTSGGKSQGRTPTLPSFLKGLRSYAAPGTQAGSSEEEDENMQDASSPDVTRSRFQRTSEKPRTNDADEPPIVVSLSDPLKNDAAAKGNLDDPRAGGDAEEPDDDYVDESERKAAEEARVARMVTEAEEAAARPTAVNLKRANKLFKARFTKRSTVHLEGVIRTSTESIAQRLQSIQLGLESPTASLNKNPNDLTNSEMEKQDPEERLNLTVTKGDFHTMRIIGQFNLGFIIVVRPPTATSSTPDLFIIDQHASDEKYNFERLTSSTKLTSQRLVHPHPIELTAVEEELIRANPDILASNGFSIDLDNISTSEDDAVGSRRAKLLTLPMSKEVTFTPSDLEELLALIMENPPSTTTTSLSSSMISAYMPRPSKVRKILASRACRSSVMIGKTLQVAQMQGIVRHMGAMDKPWSCPHGRPTMRHLYGLDSWVGWGEGEGVVGVDGEGEVETDWGMFLGKYGRGC